MTRSPRALALGLVSLVQAVERSRLLDPLLQLRAPGAGDDAGPKIPNADSIVLDGRSHELRFGGRVHALRRQAMLRGILYALSEQVGRVVTKQEVAMRLWGGRYDPTVHDNRLWANIRRFLARSGLHIESIGDGYRLSPSHGFVFVAPLG